MDGRPTAEEATMARDDDRGNDDRQHFRATEPDAFDRAYGQAQGFPHSREAVITAANIMGIGGVRQYIVQTFRVPDFGDTTFITITGPEGLTRVHLPPRVTSTMAVQREALNNADRKRWSAEASARGKARAAADKAAGKLPGFLRSKAKKEKA
jgi:hypothetical protein